MQIYFYRRPNMALAKKQQRKYFYGKTSPVQVDLILLNDELKQE